MQRELRASFRSKMMGLEDDVLRLGHRVAALIPPVTLMLVTSSPTGEPGVLAQDDEVDIEAARIVEGAHEVLILQAPVADDLRRVLAMIAAARSVERIGDHCVNVARLASPSAADGEAPLLGLQVRELSLRAERAVERALECYGRRAADGPDQLRILEDGIDQLRRGLRDRLGEHAERGGSAARWAMQMVQATSHFERIGDHAVRLAQQGATVAAGALPA